MEAVLLDGLQSFADFFSEYQDNYVIIGGTALQLIMFSQTGAVPRATHDLDLVIIIGALSENFGVKLWEYIEQAGYQSISSSVGNRNSYRFTGLPDHLRTIYPRMIELFSRREMKILMDKKSICGPIHISDEISSLSAILLDEDYYSLLLQGKIIIDGISVLNAVCMIPFKAKAWMDLTDKKNQGDLSVKSEDIKKHKNDIFRLATLLTRETRLELQGLVLVEMKQFMDRIEIEPVSTEQFLGNEYSKEFLLGIMKSVYQL